jgi:hypothetical protein
VKNPTRRASGPVALHQLLKDFAATPVNRFCRWDPLENFLIFNFWPDEGLVRDYSKDRKLSGSGYSIDPWFRHDIENNDRTRHGIDNNGKVTLSLVCSGATRAY